MHYFDLPTISLEIVTLSACKANSTSFFREQLKNCNNALHVQVSGHIFSYINDSIHIIERIDFSANVLLD